MRERLYVVHGAGPDAVGLVQQLTRPLAAAGANVVDLRQDVLHGLFTVVMVIDLGECDLRADQLRDLLAGVAEDANLTLSVAKYSPVPRSPGLRSLLVVLVGRDRPGIIARISEQLSGYRANIEFSRMVARAGIFLMELHADITQCALPLENLLGVLRAEMGALGIRTMFQAEDVFNKRKRVVCFDLGASLIDRHTLQEILRQARIPLATLAATYPAGSAGEVARQSARMIEGLSVEVVDRIAEATEVTAATTELVETLKVMGYKVAAVTRAFDFFTATLARKAALDRCFGYRLPVNDDTRALTSEPDAAFDPADRRSVIASLLASEGLTDEDITVIEDVGASESEPPGIRVEFNMRVALDYLNQHVVSRDQLLGLLGAFGAPRL